LIPALPLSLFFKEEPMVAIPTARPDVEALAAMIGAKLENAAPLELVLSPAVALTLLRLLELVLRHPALPPIPRRIASSLCDSLTKGLPAEVVQGLAGEGGPGSQEPQKGGGMTP
jgi:hypothetical protein